MMSDVKNREVIDRARDTGMALVLVCLLAGLSTGRRAFQLVGIALLLLDMIAPISFKLASKAWFGLSAILGAVVPKVLLAIIYYLFVVPVGLARKLVGKDPMQTAKWKKGHPSVFVDRNHTYGPRDLEKPY